MAHHQVEAMSQAPTCLPVITLIGWQASACKQFFFFTVRLGNDAFDHFQTRVNFCSKHVLVEKFHTNTEVEHGLYHQIDFLLN